MKINRILPWLIVGLVLVTGLIQWVYFPPDMSSLDDYRVGLTAGVIARLLLPVTFASLGALIVTRQPGNRVGWLMMVTAIVWAAPPGAIQENFFPSPPTRLYLGLWVLLWLQSWLWLLTFLSIFLILLNFPGGRPPSPRWGWLNILAPGMLLFWAVSAIFFDDIGPGSGSWTVANPIGFIPESVIIVIAVLIYLGLFILAGGSIASLIVRYRRAVPVERQQIKWLLFAGALFIMVVVPYAISFAADPPGDTWLILFLLISILAVPITIAIAILRYRLYNIDIIIRRTLVYTALTATLALVYFGLVIFLERALRSLVGSNSQIATVISTLAIAALFTPLRRQIQNGIDRRFYRRRYDAEKVLAAFSARLREEVDLERFMTEILTVIEETMQPEHLSLWLKERRRKYDTDRSR